MVLTVVVQMVDFVQGTVDHMEVEDIVDLMSAVDMAD